MSKSRFETEESYLKRKWFISNYSKYQSKISPNKINEKEAERLSKIWVNMIILHCRFPPSIEKQIYTFIQTINASNQV